MRVSRFRFFTFEGGEEVLEFIALFGMRPFGGGDLRR